jgi:hypothetical protein
MATTVKELIEQLKDIPGNTPVVFQYLLPEHTEYDTDDFTERAEALDYTDFGDAMSSVMNEWLDEVELEPDSD